MDWMKAGRPPKKEKADHYKRSEMRIAKDKRDGLKMLAAAVLKQWIDDGRPGDLPKSWVEVLEALL